MNRQFISTILLGGLVVISLQTQAAGFNKLNQSIGKVMTSNQFYQVLASTKPSQVAVNFGYPDQMQTLKNTAGETEGVVWIYRDAVQTTSKKQYVHFMIINGEMKYVTLTNAS
jgi:hypothetical protein